MATEKRQFSVRAVPNEGHPSYYRAGLRFGPDPITVTVLGQSDAPKAPYEITEAQLAALQADARVNIGPVTEASKPAKVAVEEAEQKRLDDLAKDAEKHNVKGR